MFKMPTATRVAMQLYHTSNPSRNVVATRTLKSDIINSTDAKLNSGVKPRRCCLPACLDSCNMLVHFSDVTDFKRVFAPTSSFSIVTYEGASHLVFA